MCKTSPCFGLDEAFWGGRDKPNGSQVGKGALITLKSSTPLPPLPCQGKGLSHPHPQTAACPAPASRLANKQQLFGALNLILAERRSACSNHHRSKGRVGVGAHNFLLL